MHKYVHYSCRTLFAGLLFFGSIRSNDTISENILITSHKYESSGTDITAKPGIYSLDSTYFVPFGAPEEGYKKAALTKLTFATTQISEIAHKRVIMNNTPGQPSPLYNQKILHVAVSSLGGLYVVTGAQPDTVYRYTGFDNEKTAEVHACKLMGVNDTSCSIMRLSVCLNGINEYVVVELASLDGSEHSINCALSTTKQVAPPKKSPEVLAAQQRIYDEQDKNMTEDEKEEAKIEREAESKKLVSKYVFTPFNIVKRTEEQAAVALLDFLPEECKNQGTWQITDICSLGSSFTLEVRLIGSDFHRLVTYDTSDGVGRLKPLAMCHGYYKSPQKSPKLAWQQEPNMCFADFNRKKYYCLVVGDFAAHADSGKSLIAFCAHKKDNLAPLKIGGDTALPGPISDVKSENETVYVAVAQSNTNAQPGVFYSQPIFDGTGSIAAWTSWQRTAGTSEPVVAILPNDGGLRVMTSTQDNQNKLRLHTLKWRGRTINSIEEAYDQTVAKELAKQELVKEQLEIRNKELEAQKEKERLAAGTQAPEVTVKVEPQEAPEPSLIKNDGFSFGKGLKPTHHGASLFLRELLEDVFKPEYGGVRKMIDVPAEKGTTASFIIAAGYNSVLFAQTNQVKDRDGSLITRLYKAPYNENGAIDAECIKNNTLDALLCVNGALKDLGFIDHVHMASNGTDSWVVVAGPNGVAVLSAYNGAGINARAGFGDHFKEIKETYTFKTLGSYEWVRALSSDDQFLYVTTEDVIHRIPLKRSCFNSNATPEVCTLATGDDIGKVCDGYVFNDVCISQGMIIAATPGGLIATAPGVDCRTVTDAVQVVWQKVPMPAACASIEHLVPLSITGRAHDVAAKGQLYVIACSLFDETASITRLFIDHTNLENRIQLVPDVKTKYTGSWLNYVHRINAFMTDGSIHLVGRARFEGRTVDLAKVTAGTKRNSGVPQFTFDDNTHQINTIMRCSGSGSVFVTADDGVRVYE